MNSISVSSSNRFQIRHVPSLHDCHRKCGGSDLRPTAGFSWPVTVGRQSDRPAGQNHKYRSGEFVFYFSVTSRTLIATWVWSFLLFILKKQKNYFIFKHWISKSLKLPFGKFGDVSEFKAKSVFGLLQIKIALLFN